jgi:hypothetical protein
VIEQFDKMLTFVSLVFAGIAAMGVGTMVDAETIHCRTCAKLKGLL